MNTMDACGKVRTQIDRLTLAGKIAPILRNKRKQRTLKVINADGKIVREICEVQFVDALMAREKIELAVHEDVAKWFCRMCGERLYRTKPGRVVTMPNKTGTCKECRAAATRRHRESPCPGPGDRPCPNNAMLKALVFKPHRVRKRHGQPARCGACAQRAHRRVTAFTPEQISARNENLHKGWGGVNLTPEQRSARARKARAALTAALTPQQRSDAARKASAARTPQQRSAAMRKGNATRKAKREAMGARGR